MSHGNIFQLHDAYWFKAFKGLGETTTRRKPMIRRFSVCRSLSVQSAKAASIPGSDPNKNIEIFVIHYDKSIHRAWVISQL